jgi:hypothetical protein
VVPRAEHALRARYGLAAELVQILAADDADRQEDE